MYDLECIYLKKFQICWTNLEVKYIEKILAENVKYRSDWVLNPLTGKSEVLCFMEAKFDKIKIGKKKNLIHLFTNLGYQNKKSMKPCLIISQIISDELIQVLFQIEIMKKQITDIRLCTVPDLKEVSFEG